MAAVRRRRSGWSGQRREKREASLLLLSISIFSLSFAIALAAATQSTLYRCCAFATAEHCHHRVVARLLAHIALPWSALPRRPTSQAIRAEVMAVGHFRHRDLIGVPLSLSSPWLCSLEPSRPFLSLIRVSLRTDLAHTVSRLISTASPEQEHGFLPLLSCHRATMHMPERHRCLAKP